MKILLALFTALILVSAPAMAESSDAALANDTIITEETLSVENIDDAQEAEEAVEAVEEGTPIQDEAEAPVAEEEAVEAVESDAAPSVDIDAATQTCTDETNEKVKLPEGASDAEQAQWNAALAECLKNKGVTAE